MFLPEEGGRSRSLHLSVVTLRVGMVGLLLLGVAAATMASSWWFLAVEAGKSWRLEALVDSLQAEQTRVRVLAAELGRVEQEYEKVRALFTSGADPVAPDLWLPPTGLAGTRDIRADPSEGDDLPTSWPLTEAGFVTRALIEGEAGEHPGVDIAVGTDSYVRAAGSGRVVRAGDDPLYGFFVVLEHGRGYQTVYGHLSMILVERGQAVEKNEVIALSGSTGRSTAAHLHFEILLDGIPIDPLTLVAQPG
jgi:murein DD-endopeptidase MepM/ murein hydrolase activator NlpD